MKALEIGSPVTLVRYEPGPNNKPGKAVEYPGIVIGAERVSNSEVPNLHIAFLHPARGGVLNGAGWRDAFDRCMSVPHEDVKGNAPFYYTEPDDYHDLLDSLKDQGRIIVDLQADLKVKDKLIGERDQIIADQSKRLSQTTEGKDEQLQKLADEGARECRDCGSKDRTQRLFVLKDGSKPTTATVYTPENSVECTNAFHGVIAPQPAD